MTNIIDRFAALPRARRGSEVVVIATERELLELIGDAQASEAELVLRAAQSYSIPRRFLAGMPPRDTETELVSHRRAPCYVEPVYDPRPQEHQGPATFGRQWVGAYRPPGM